MRENFYYISSLSSRDRLADATRSRRPERRRPELFRDSLKVSPGASFDRKKKSCHVLERKLLMRLPDPAPQHSTTSSFSVSNFTRTWVLDAHRPFVNVDFVATAAEWVPRTKENNYVQSLSLFRFLLRRVTQPRNKIKECATRLNGRNGRVEKLKDLPNAVETTPLGIRPHLAQNKISDTSAGAIVAAGLLTNVYISQATSTILKTVTQARSRAVGPLHPTFKLLTLTQIEMERSGRV